MQNTATLLAQNSWLQGPAKILAGHKTYIAWAKPAVNPVEGNEPLALLSLRHEEEATARTAIILGPNGYFNDNCFFATEAEVLSRHKPLWPAYHALHDHMRQIQAEQLLPNISPKIVASVLNNPFGFFTAFVLSGNDKYRVENITTRNDNGINIARIVASPTKCSPKFAAMRAQLELKATKGRPDIFISGPAAGRGNPTMTKKGAAKLFEPFFHQAMQGKGSLIYLIKHSIPILEQAAWLLPIVQKCYFDNVESLAVNFSSSGHVGKATFDLEKLPVDGIKPTATLTIGNDGYYGFKPTTACPPETSANSAASTGFDGLNTFAFRYARFLRRAAPQP